MTYSCDGCGYSTDNKSNYGKHIKTSAHIKIEEKNAEYNSLYMWLW